MPAMLRSKKALGRAVARWFLVVLYALAGVLHLALPRAFLTITPGWVPYPAQVILVTGLCEIAGAVALAQGHWPGLRRAAGVALALYALCVWPANIHHMMLDLARPDHGLGYAYHLPRMVAQPLLIWLALWCSKAPQAVSG